MTIQDLCYILIGICIGLLLQETYWEWRDRKMLLRYQEMRRSEVLERRKDDLDAAGVHQPHVLDPDDLG